MLIEPSEYITGVPAIDNQHRHYFELLEKFVAGSREGNISREEFNEDVNEVIAYALEHFDSEEFLMRSIDYPLYEEHLAKHNIFRDKMDGFMEDIDAGGIKIDDFMEKISKWLVEWVKIQMLDDDAKLAKYIKENNIVC
jgi:hemerythrin